MVICPDRDMPPAFLGARDPSGPDIYIYMYICICIYMYIICIHSNAHPGLKQERYVCIPNEIYIPVRRLAAREKCINLVVLRATRLNVMLLCMFWLSLLRVSSSHLSIRRLLSSWFRHELNRPFASIPRPLPSTGKPFLHCLVPSTYGHYGVRIYVAFTFCHGYFRIPPFSIGSKDNRRHILPLVEMSSASVSFHFYTYCITRTNSS